MMPPDVQTEGAHLLEPVLGPHGFLFGVENEGSSSGGRFASGTFSRGNRALELHFRYSLGLVSYRVGAQTIGHVDYVRAVRATGVQGEPSYPGFSEDPLDGFRHLARDLALFGGTFISGSDAEFNGLAQWVVQNPPRRGVVAT